MKETDSLYWVLRTIKPHFPNNNFLKVTLMLCFVLLTLKGVPVRRGRVWSFVSFEEFLHGQKEHNPPYSSSEEKIKKMLLV